MEKSDPYFHARDRAQQRLVEAVHQLELWGGIIGATSRGDTAVQAQVREMRHELRSIGKAVDGLESTVALVERLAAGSDENGAKFRHIDGAEVEARRAFIHKSRAELAGLTASIEAALEDDGKQGRPRNRMSGLKGAIASKLSSAADRRREKKKAKRKRDERRQQQQQLAEEEKERDLEQLLAAVTHMGDAAKTIGSELTDQNTILTAMDRDASYASVAVKRLNKGINKILTTDSSAPVYVIIALTLVLVTLFVLIILL